MSSRYECTVNLDLFIYPTEMIAVFPDKTNTLTVAFSWTLFKGRLSNLV